MAGIQIIKIHIRTFTCQTESGAGSVQAQAGDAWRCLYSSSLSCLLKLRDAHLSHLRLWRRSSAPLSSADAVHAGRVEGTDAGADPIEPIQSDDLLYGVCSPQDDTGGSSAAKDYLLLIRINGSTGVPTKISLPTSSQQHHGAEETARAHIRDVCVSPCGSIIGVLKSNSLLLVPLAAYLKSDSKPWPSRLQQTLSSGAAQNPIIEIRPPHQSGHSSDSAVCFVFSSAASGQRRFIVIATSTGHLHYYSLKSGQFYSSQYVCQSIANLAVYNDPAIVDGSPTLLVTSRSGDQYKVQAALPPSTLSATGAIESSSKSGKSNHSKSSHKSHHLHLGGKHAASSSSTSASSSGVGEPLEFRSDPAADRLRCQRYQLGFVTACAPSRQSATPAAVKFIYCHTHNTNLEQDRLLLYLPNDFSNALYTYVIPCRTLQFELDVALIYCLHRSDNGKLALTVQCRHLCSLSGKASWEQVGPQFAASILLTLDTGLQVGRLLGLCLLTPRQHSLYSSSTSHRQVWRGLRYRDGLQGGDNEDSRLSSLSKQTDLLPTVLVLHTAGCLALHCRQTAEAAFLRAAATRGAAAAERLGIGLKLDVQSLFELASRHLLANQRLAAADDCAERFCSGSGKKLAHVIACEWDNGADVGCAGAVDNDAASRGHLFSRLVDFLTGAAVALNRMEPPANHGACRTAALLALTLAAQDAAELDAVQIGRDKRGKNSRQQLLLQFCFANGQFVDSGGALRVLINGGLFESASQLALNLRVTSECLTAVLDRVAALSPMSPRLANRTLRQFLRYLPAELINGVLQTGSDQPLDALCDALDSRLDELMSSDAAAVDSDSDDELQRLLESWFRPDASPTWFLIHKQPHRPLTRRWASLGCRYFGRKAVGFTLKTATKQNPCPLLADQLNSRLITQQQQLQSPSSNSTALAISLNYLLAYADSNLHFYCPTLLSPPRVLHQPGVVAVSAGLRHALVLLNDGRLLSAGSNAYGQLGIGVKAGVVNGESGDGEEALLLLRPVVGLASRRVVQISAGHYTSACIVEAKAGDNSVNGEGEVYTWGWNALGQLGLDDCENRRQPELVQVKLPPALEASVGGSSAAASQLKTRLLASRVACGRDHTLFLTGSGRLFASGANSRNQLLHTEPQKSSTPLELTTGGGPNRLLLPAGDVAQVDTKAYLCAAITRSDNRLHLWGLCRYMNLQLATLKSVRTLLPADAPPGSLRLLACGYESCLVSLPDGSLVTVPYVDPETLRAPVRGSPQLRIVNGSSELCAASDRGLHCILDTDGCLHLWGEVSSHLLFTMCHQGAPRHVPTPYLRLPLAGQSVKDVIDRIAQLSEPLRSGAEWLRASGAVNANTAELLPALLCNRGDFAGSLHWTLRRCQLLDALDDESARAAVLKMLKQLLLLTTRPQDSVADLIHAFGKAADAHGDDDNLRVKIGFLEQLLDSVMTQTVAVQLARCCHTGSFDPARFSTKFCLAWLRHLFPRSAASTSALADFTKPAANDVPVLRLSLTELITRRDRQQADGFYDDNLWHFACCGRQYPESDLFKLSYPALKRQLDEVDGDLVAADGAELSALVNRLIRRDPHRLNSLPCPACFSRSLGLPSEQ